MIEEILKECPHCGNKFVPKSKLQIFCNACTEDQKRKNVTKICPGCGVQFETNRMDKKFCTINCQREDDLRKKRKNENEQCKSKQSHDKICPMCGVEFVAQYRHKVYCSAECQSRACSKKKVEMRKEKRIQGELYEKICPTCGKEFKTTRPHQKYCCHSCSNRFRNADYGNFDKSLEWKRSTTDESMWQCPYQINVECSCRNCDRCGWNPKVAKARTEAFARKRQGEA
jgi:hypothetical protein